MGNSFNKPQVLKTKDYQ